MRILKWREHISPKRQTAPRDITAAVVCVVTAARLWHLFSLMHFSGLNVRCERKLTSNQLPCLPGIQPASLTSLTVLTMPSVAYVTSNGCLANQKWVLDLCGRKRPWLRGGTEWQQICWPRFEVAVHRIQRRDATCSPLYRQSATSRRFRKAFTKLDPIRTSVRVQERDSHWTDFHEILYLEFILKSVDA
jgi:hypothetical protein